MDLVVVHGNGTRILTLVIGVRHPQDHSAAFAKRENMNNIEMRAYK